MSHNGIKESDIQKACCDLLDAYKIPWLRMNTGAMSGAHKGKRWYVRFGRKGQADLIAWPKLPTHHHVNGLTNLAGEFTDTRVVIIPCVRSLWLEIKRPDGKQSDDQKEFQTWAESIGHTYLLIRDVDELAKWLKGNI